MIWQCADRCSRDDMKGSIRNSVYQLAIRAFLRQHRGTLSIGNREGLVVHRQSSASDILRGSGDCHVGLYGTYTPLRACLFVASRHTLEFASSLYETPIFSSSRERMSASGLAGWVLGLIYRGFFLQKNTLDHVCVASGYGGWSLFEQDLGDGVE